MALGTVTKVALAGHQPSAPSFTTLISFALDSSYPTGGETGLKAKVDAALKQDVTILGFVAQDCGGYLPVWDPTNSKLKVYYVNNDGGADGPMIEVPDTTDLSAVTVKGLLFFQ